MRTWPDRLGSPSLPGNSCKKPIQKLQHNALAGMNYKSLMLKKRIYLLHNKCMMMPLKQKIYH